MQVTRSGLQRPSEYLPVEGSKARMIGQFETVSDYIAKACSRLFEQQIPGVVQLMARGGRARSVKEIHEENISTVLLTLHRLGTSSSYTEAFKASGLPSHGTFSSTLNELVGSGFIQREERSSGSVFYELTKKGESEAKIREIAWWRHAISVTSRYLGRFLYDAEMRLTPVRPGTEFREKLRIMIDYGWKKSRLFDKLTDFLVLTAYLKAADPPPVWGKRLLPKIKKKWVDMDNQRFLNSMRDTATIGRTMAYERPDSQDRLLNDLGRTMTEITSQTPWARQVCEDAVEAFTREAVWLYEGLKIHAKSGWKWLLKRYEGFASGVILGVTTGVLALMLIIVLEPWLMLIQVTRLSPLFFALTIPIIFQPAALAYKYLSEWIPVRSPELRGIALVAITLYGMLLIVAFIIPLHQVVIPILLVFFGLMSVVIGALLGFADRVNKIIRRYVRTFLRTRKRRDQEGTAAEI